jgi:hypothetical protein
MSKTDFWEKSSIEMIDYQIANLRTGLQVLGLVGLATGEATNRPRAESIDLS